EHAVEIVFLIIKMRCFHKKCFILRHLCNFFCKLSESRRPDSYYPFLVYTWHQFAVEIPVSGVLQLKEHVCYLLHIFPPQKSYPYCTIFSVQRTWSIKILCTKIPTFRRYLLFNSFPA